MNTDVKLENDLEGPDDSRMTEVAPTPGNNVPAANDPRARAHGDGVTTRASDAVVIDEVLDVDGAIQLLRIGRNTVYELVGRNAIPHRRLGKQIRFSRAAIMRWLDPWSSQGAKERQ